MTIEAERRRAEHYKAQVEKLRRELAGRERAEHYKEQVEKLRRELAAERRKLDENFCRGSAETMTAVYASLPTDDAALALSQLMMASHKKKPPFRLSPAVEAAARREAIEVLRKVGLDFDGEGPDEIVREMAL